MAEKISKCIGPFFITLSPLSHLFLHRRDDNEQTTTLIRFYLRIFKRQDPYTRTTNCIDTQRQRQSKGYFDIMTTILGYDSVGNEYTGSVPTLSSRIREKNQNIFPTVTTHHSYRSSVSSGPSTGGGTFEDVFPDQFGTLLSSGDMAQVRRLSNIHRMGKLHREINSQMSSWERTFDTRMTTMKMPQNTNGDSGPRIALR